MSALLETTRGRFEKAQTFQKIITGIPIVKAIPKNSYDYI